LACGTSHAALVSRAGGQAYYDTDLDITWSANADIAGNLEWAGAQSWIASLNTGNYLGVNNWRLPTTGQPDASCSIQGGGDSYGNGCTGSEMGHLFNLEGITAASPGLFTNVRALSYWSGTEYASDTSRAWSFSFNSGDQVNVFDKESGLRAWAVSPGDTVVPLPGAVYLLATGIVALAGRAHRRKRHQPQNNCG
jgi:hypothetical protein